jgi:hypothetical protein
MILSQRPRGEELEDLHMELGQTKSLSSLRCVAAPLREYSCSGL